MEKVKIYKWKGEYYLAFKENNSDQSVATYLKLDLKDYREKMEQMYNRTFGPEIYFRDEADCQLAIEWIESIITLNKLCE